MLEMSMPLYNHCERWLLCYLVSLQRNSLRRLLFHLFLTFHNACPRCLPGYKIRQNILHQRHVGMHHFKSKKKKVQA